MTITETLSRRPVSLRAFQPDAVPAFSGDAAANSDCGSTAIGRVVVGKQLVPARDINQLGGEVAKGLSANTERIDVLSQRVNEAAYGAIARIYDLVPERETPQDFFQHHMRIADNTLRFLAEQVNPADPRVAAPDVVYNSPADVIKELASPDTDQDTKKDLTARLAFALISAEQQLYYDGTATILQEVDTMIGDEIVAMPRNSGSVYTVHDNLTNVLDRTALNLKSLFAEPISDETHIKEHDLLGDFQHIGLTDDESVGLIAVRSRIKQSETALLKTVRAAILRTEGELAHGEDTAKGDNLIVSDTKDLVGSTYVSLEAEDSYDPKVSKLRANVVAKYKELFPHLTDEDFVEDSKTNGRSDSVDFTFQRILIHNLPGIEGYYEVMFFGKDYFNYKYAVGETDQKTGKPDGCAHALYEGTRFFKTYNEIFKPENADEIERRMYAERTEQLLDDNRVDTADLQKQYEEQLVTTRKDVYHLNGLAHAGIVYSAI